MPCDALLRAAAARSRGVLGPPPSPRANRGRRRRRAAGVARGKVALYFLLRDGRGVWPTDVGVLIGFILVGLVATVMHVKMPTKTFGFIEFVQVLEAWLCGLGLDMSREMR